MRTLNLVSPVVSGFSPQTSLKCPCSHPWPCSWFKPHPSINKLSALGREPLVRTGKEASLPQMGSYKAVAQHIFA